MTSLSKLAIIDASLSEDERTVTLIRADGEIFTFTCRGIQGYKGDKGEKGDVGPRGESAYDIAARLALTTASNATTWLASLKGDKGAPGINGTKGIKGDPGADGVTPDFQIGTTSWLAAGNNADLSISKSGITYKLNFGIPTGQTGTTGANGVMPTLSIGTVSFSTVNGGNASASLTQSGNAYKLNLVIPKGSTGATPADVSGADAYAPQINFVVNYIANGDSPSVSYSDSSHTVGSDWVRTVTLNIPKGATGNRGANGDNGADAPTYHPYYYFVGLGDYRDILSPPTGLMGCAFDFAGLSYDFEGNAVDRYYGDGQPWTWLGGFVWRHSEGSFQYLWEARDDNSNNSYHARGYNDSHTWTNTATQMQTFVTKDYSYSGE